MLRNYLTTALRNLVRNRMYAAINIVGLALGFAAALLIALFVRDELTYDRWIPDHQNVYIATETIGVAGQTPFAFDMSPASFAGLIKADLPGIQSIARVSTGQTIGVGHGDIEANEKVYWADPDIFAVLPLPVVAGNLAAALQSPDGVVLTRMMARKYFGRDAPIGETLELARQHTVQVRAVIEDLPSNTQLDAQIIASGLASYSPLTEFDTNASPESNPLNPGIPRDSNPANPTVYTYFRLLPNRAISSLQQAFSDLIERHEGAAIRNSEIYGTKRTFAILPMTAIHLRPHGSASMKPHGDMGTLYAVSTLAGLVLLAAAFNFVTLVTARASRRAIEVGVRSASGAQRRDLVVQFIGEALIYVALGLGLAIALARFSLPELNGFLERTITFGWWRHSTLPVALLALWLTIGIAAGLYPAVVLSAFKPASVLKGTIFAQSRAGIVRKVLVAAQFIFLIGLIIATGVTFRQMQFAADQSRRFDTDQVVSIATACKSTFVDAVRALPGVRAAACSSPFAVGGGLSLAQIPNRSGEHVQTALVSVDFDFLELLGVHPIAGRLFSRNHPADALGPDATFAMQHPAAIVINDVAAAKFGFASPQAAIGQVIKYDEGNPSEIIGVVPDLTMDAIHRLKSPTFYFVAQKQFGALNVKLSGQGVPKTLRAIDQLWTQHGEPRPIVRTFLDQRVENFYRDITRQSEIFSIFAAVATLLACLGLFGLASFVAESRTKEIGIRKAMGASKAELLRMLLWQFARPVLWANVIAWPAAYFIMRHWLEGFAYHIDLKPWMFMAASVLALVIAVATVIGHALLIARAKPVTALRYE